VYFFCPSLQVLGIIIRNSFVDIDLILVLENNHIPNFYRTVLRTRCILPTLFSEALVLQVAKKKRTSCGQDDRKQ
jgi:hypothetical protein